MNDLIHKVFDMDVRKSLLLLVFAVGFSVAAQAQHKQNMAVKTNLLYDATATANLGLEVKLAPRWSFDLSGDFNQWTIRDHKWKHWFAQPEVRYWFCDAFAKHFVGIHAIGGEFNIGNIENNISFLGSDFSKLGSHRYQGWGAGGGIAYGYALPLSRYWNLEFEAGFGYAYLNYDKFECRNCGRQVGSGDHHYFGPTKAAINLVYVF